VEKKNDQLILTESEAAALGCLFAGAGTTNAALNAGIDSVLLAAVAQALTEGASITRKAAPETKKEVKP